ncbi:MAG: hypothetical protein E7001_03195 [Coriobacteriaceae bacterium]|nr:hypothetical protein [Coriobacteriaceae bacterium]
MSRVEYVYTYENYRDHVSMRDLRAVQGTSIFSILMLGPFLLLIPYAIQEGDVGVLLGLLVMLFTVLWSAYNLIYTFVKGRMPWLDFSRRAPWRQYAGAHGGDEEGFRQVITVDDEGIMVLYGPVGCKYSEMQGTCKPWPEWRRVRTSPGGTLIECKRKQGGCLGMIIGLRYLYWFAERDGFEDAFLPDSVPAAEREQLLATVREHVR